MDSHPNPQSFRNFVKQWKYLIICYGERNEGKVYVKVDGNPRDVGTGNVGKSRDIISCLTNLTQRTTKRASQDVLSVRQEHTPLTLTLARKQCT